MQIYRHIQFSLLLIVFLLLNLSFGQVQRQFPQGNLDHGRHTVNDVRIVITNYNASDPSYAGGQYGLHLNYPPGSTQTMLAHYGIWVGAVIGNDTLVSTGAGYESSAAGDRGDTFEMYPGFEEADTIYSANIFENPGDIDPLWKNLIFDNSGFLHENYIAVSEEDFISQYYDYKITKQTPNAPDILDDHTPLNIHVIQRSYAWSFFLYNKVVIFDYLVINDGDKNMRDVAFLIYSDPHMGDVEQGGVAGDDYTIFNEDIQMMIQSDSPGGSDGPPINDAKLGYLLLGGPKDHQNSDVKLTFRHWKDGQDPVYDNDRYRNWMTSGEVMPDMDPSLAGSVRGSLGFGSFGDLAPGDTMQFTVAMVLGDGISEVVENAKAAKKLYDAGYNVPLPPPNPEFTTYPQNKSVLLDWTWLPQYDQNGINPEEYEDPSRTDGNLRDFDGYRVYRSNKGEEGPWQLIAQYDSINQENYDTGLQYNLRDRGLVNGIRYWYSITAFDMPEISDDGSIIPSLESPKIKAIREVIPGISQAESGSKDIYVVPNPYRADVDYSNDPSWEYPTQEGRTQWYDIDRRIAFMNLPEECTIHIYTLAGEFINKIEHDHNLNNQTVAFWNLLNINNHTVGSGLYYFAVKEPGGKTRVGKFVIVK